MLLAAIAAGAISHAPLAADLSPNVEMMLMPGSGKAIPMPPSGMRLDIEKRMRRGDVPDVILVSGSEIGRKCRTSGYLLGCVTDTSCALGIVYVRSGLNRELEHMARVHEFAHCLYGWKH